MNYEIILSSAQQENLRKIISDLKFALKDVSSKELLLIFEKSVTASLQTTVNTKKKIFRKTINTVKNTIVRYKNNGILDSFQIDTVKTKNFLLSLPKKAKVALKKFQSLKREEQIEVVIVTLLTLAIFFAFSGGLNLEGGIPDMDIAIGGIDVHRSIITHSILLGFGVEFIGRFLLLVMEAIKERMPKDRHFIWDKIYSYIDNHKEKAIAAMWLGIGMHFLKDSGIFGDGFTPYKDLPFTLTEGAHKGLFFANGIASSIFANVKGLPTSHKIENHGKIFDK